ncbi:G protein-coupled glucose receptor regulating Gpa2-domain-containing protein [Parachaetomium inaequale]|uniref:G protein-coupled glucose receptor regulating Gpa2-domain-containing protein n=1 Tax=Parachaetomium inaequale TaxID=2588326 RepID=A0AAN6SV26_9PEZI|nr:G protein-coupled glucose receptor regulating Gpa2-domain-containing protein [Parachaetomium inaequale]
MMVPRWIFPGMPFHHLSDGTATSETPSVAARHASTVDTTEPIVGVLLILALTFASISVLSTLSALYWLILLLIKSDFLKSMALMVFAVATFVWGNIPSDSAFCQVSGFALAVGIESSDIAVLLIALHSAMYIFRPRSGLYPYRQLAYLVFYVWPILAACLAFINGHGYENMGPYCYLRTDRSWARMALSWVPRYLICAGIVVIYVFIYFYVRKRMGDYGRRRSEAMQAQPLGGSAKAVSTPRLCYNGLIPSTPCSRRTSATDTISAAKDGLRPPSSIGPARPASARTSVEVAERRSSVKWNWPVFTEAPASGGNRPSADDAHDSVSPSSSTYLSPPAAAYTPRPALSLTDDLTDSPPRNSSRILSLHHHPQPLLSTGPDADSSPSITITPADMLPPDPAHDDTLQTNQEHKNKKKNLRQLRSLFVYPLVYIIVWLFPFVSHVLGYDDDSIRHGNYHSSSSSSIPQNGQGQGWDSEKRDPPHWLLVVSIISLCVQGVVDCVLFMMRETPWRYARGRGFWVSLGKRWAWSLRGRGRWWKGSWEGGGAGASSDGVGRTREEMLVDGRLARERREGEVAVERERGVVATRAAAGREWWDVYGDDGEGGFGHDGDEGDEEGEVEVRQEV